MALSIKKGGPSAGCLACGQTPVVDGEIQDGIDLETDINWGENAELCINCASLIADLIDRVSVEEHAAVQKELRSMSKDYQRLSKRHIRLKNQVKAIEKGEKARKAVKSGS